MPLASQVADIIAGVPVLRFVPLKVLNKNAVVVWLHGGGWVLGTAAVTARMCSIMAARCGVEVISVDYRLAPQHVYPAALDDVSGDILAQCVAPSPHLRFIRVESKCGPLLIYSATQ